MLEDAVIVLHCRGADMLGFDSFINVQEKSRVGWDDGVFKIVIDPSVERQTADTVIVDLVLRNVRNIQDQQIMQGAADNIYQYRSVPAKPLSKKHFKEQCSSISSFSEETCCSQKLESHSVTDVVTHFFSDIVEKRSVACVDHNDFEERKKDLLMEGAKLREVYESTVKKGLPYMNIKKPSKRCSCIDCVPDTMPHSGVENTPILYAAGVALASNEPISIIDGFSLSLIKSILDFTEYHYDGLSSPYCYLGSKHSFFALHIEDALLWSINFLHLGLPKIWIVIPPRATLLLMYHLWKSGLSVGNTSCWNILGHKTVLPSLHWLEERAIPYKLVVQRIGEAIVLYPSAAHFGFNCGWNIAEAVNFGTVSWVAEGVNAPRCQCLPGQIHLNMSKFVAAFRPELLDRYLTRKFIETDRSIAAIKYFQESIMDLCKRSENTTASCKTGINVPKKRETSTSQYLQCPAPFCSKNFPYRKSSSLINHVLNDHKPLIHKCRLLEQISESLLRLKK